MKFRSACELPDIQSEYPLSSNPEADRRERRVNRLLANQKRHPLDNPGTDVILTARKQLRVPRGKTETHRVKTQTAHCAVNAVPTNKRISLAKRRLAETHLIGGWSHLPKLRKSFLHEARNTSSDHISESVSSELRIIDKVIQAASELVRESWQLFPLRKIEVA